MLRLLRLFVNVKEEEVGALLLSFLYFFALLAGWYMLRPLRDQLGVAAGTKTISWLFTATFVSMLVLVPVYSWFAARIQRATLIPYLYRFFLLNLLVFFILWRTHTEPVWTARVYFVWASVYNVFSTSVLWSFMADIWRGEQGKRLFGFIAAGGSAGAIVGPLVILTLVNVLGPANVILVSAALLEVAAQCVRALSRRAPSAPRGEAVGGGILAGFSRVLSSPYLMAICAQILLYTVTSTFLYSLQLKIFGAQLHDANQQRRLFATQDEIVNIATLVLQAGVTGRLLARLGLTVALAALPLVTFGGFAAVAIAPSVLLVTAFTVVRRATHFAFDRPAREVLFTAVPREDKYKAKSFVDTAVYRGGDALGGWLFTNLGPAMTPVALAVSVGWLYLSVYLSRAFKGAAS